MSKRISKQQKRLAKFIVASLLFSGWSVAMPSMASAVSTITTTIERRLRHVLGGSRGLRLPLFVFFLIVVN